MPNRVSVTRGMAGAVKRVKLQCQECGLKVPIYRGRYPKMCSHCGGELAPFQETESIDHLIGRVIDGENPKGVVEGILGSRQFEIGQRVTIDTLQRPISGKVVGIEGEFVSVETKAGNMQVHTSNLIKQEQTLGDRGEILPSQSATPDEKEREIRHEPGPGEVSPTMGKGGIWVGARVTVSEDTSDDRGKVGEVFEITEDGRMRVRFLDESQGTFWPRELALIDTPDPVFDPISVPRPVGESKKFGEVEDFVRTKRADKVDVILMQLGIPLNTRQRIFKNVFDLPELSVGAVEQVLKVNGITDVLIDQALEMLRAVGESVRHEQVFQGKEGQPPLVRDAIKAIRMQTGALGPVSFDQAARELFIQVPGVDSMEIARDLLTRAIQQMPDLLTRG